MTLPFVVAVAGHRLVLDPTRLEAQVRTFLHELHPALPHTAAADERVMLSSLAEGADRLVARVALAEGWRLIAVLPFEQDRFEQDFPATRQEFRTLLQQAEVVVQPQTPGYEAAALYMARQAHVMLVLWDGQPFDGVHVGGTAHTVQLRLDPLRLGGSLRSADECEGPIFHVWLPRTVDPPPRAPGWLSSGGGHDANPPAVLTDTISNLEQFNSQALWRSQQPQWREAQKQLMVTRSSETRLVHAFATASIQSDQSQLTASRRLVGSLLVLAVGAVIKETFLLTGQVTVGVVTYLAALAVAILVLKGRRQTLDTRRRHVEMRVIAEMLRIGVALRLSGSRRSPTQLVAVSQWHTVRWIPDAVDALWATLPSPIVVPQYANEVWIKGQLEKFLWPRRSAVRKELNLLEAVTSLLFTLAIILSLSMVCVAVWGPTDAATRNQFIGLFTTFNAICLLGVGGLGFYAQKRGYSEDDVRYAALQQLYKRAADRWDQLNGFQHRELTEELAREALTELVTWMHTARLRRLDLWR
jgi:hypothetical protein